MYRSETCPSEEIFTDCGLAPQLAQRGMDGTLDFSGISMGPPQIWQRIRLSFFTFVGGQAFNVSRLMRPFTAIPSARFAPGFQRITLGHLFFGLEWHIICSSWLTQHA